MSAASKFPKNTNTIVSNHFIFAPLVCKSNKSRSPEGVAGSFRFSRIYDNYQLDLLFRDTVKVIPSSQVEFVTYDHWRSTESFVQIVDRQDFVLWTLFKNQSGPI